MRIDQELATAPPDRDTVLTIGVFDGMHRGHGYLMGRLIAEAKKAESLAAVVTFRNHPDSVLKSDFRPQYITPLDERVGHIKARGVDLVFPVTFDKELSGLAVDEFVDLLQRRLRMRGMVIGPDFAMGQGRKGDAKTLADLGKTKGFFVSVIRQFEEEGQAIRSTAVREALAQGDIARVEWMLGRRFSLTGVVTRGEGRGRQLGYPTANIEVSEELATPGDGIYATWAHVGGESHMSSTSVGTRPTFDEGWRTVEAYLMDFDRDLYGKDVRLEFVQRLRDELRFDSVEALIEQIGDDVSESREVLGRSPPQEA